MTLSRPSLHAPVASAVVHVEGIRSALAAATSARVIDRLAIAPRATVLQIPLSTVSLEYNFDAYIDIWFKGSAADAPTTLLLDSGNSVLVVPRWEDIAALPNSGVNYHVLGTSPEPWGCPANVVRGPIELMTTGGTVYTIPDCVFYACTGDLPGGGGRTANFGAGCLSPWSSSGWNDLTDLGIVLQAPLSYNIAYPFAEFNYAPATTTFSSSADPHVTSVATLNLYNTLPPNYQFFDIIPNIEWMSLSPFGLTIGNTKTRWPGTPPTPPIAMIDTGGGPVFLSDPNDYVYGAEWPEPAANPRWTAGSQNCESTRDPITITLGDKNRSMSYTIDPMTLPPSVQGLTLVACQVNQYMRNQQGMNIGGISALINYIVVDYKMARVGLKPKNAPTKATT